MTETEKAYKDEIRAETLALARKQIETCVGGMLAIAEKLLRAVGSDVTVRSDFTSPAAAKANDAAASGKLSAADEARLDGDILGALQKRAENDGFHESPNSTQLASLIGWEVEHVSKALIRLVRQGQVVRTGKHKATRYSLPDPQFAKEYADDGVKWPQGADEGDGQR